jgi:hypothetical protein
MNSLAQLGACGAVAAKTSDQPQQPFNESLLTASKAYSKIDRADDGNTKSAPRQKSASEDEEATDTVHRDDVAPSLAVSQQVVQPQQSIPAQQAQVIPADSALLPLSFGGAVSTTFTSTETTAQPAGAQSSNDPSQTGSIQSGSGILNINAPGTPFYGTWNSTSGADANRVQNATPSAPSNELPDAVENVAADTDSNAVPSLAQDEAANAVQNVGVNSVSNALPEAAQGPVLRAALSVTTSTVLASTATDTPKGQTISSRPGAAQTLPAANLNVSGGTANPLVSPIQPSRGFPGAVHASVSSFNSVLGAKQPVVASANGKDESKDATNDAAGLKQHVRLASDHAESQKSPQQDAPAGDQSQIGASSQAQSATLSQTSSTANSVVATFQAQNTPTASLASSASTHADVAASAAKLPEAAASTSAAVAQPTPVINTAKLIQSIGQSEMRVGMRSNEFGNISISTTANKDVISAQISLDHGELAKALAAQLPEMQARLGGNQPMDVRIDMNGASTGHGTGTSGSMSNGTSDQSSTGKQQSAYTASSYSDNSVVEKQLFPVAAATATGYGNLNARLDIRI